MVGRCVSDVVIGDKKVFQTSPMEFEKGLVGQTIRELTRRGKFLIMALENSYCIIHLGMTGQLTFRDPVREDSDGFLRHPVTGLQRARQHAPDRHTHVQILFVDGSALLYRDIRKFGKVFLLNGSPEALAQFFQKLGLEPFTPEYALKPFLGKFRRRKLRVKSLLLDQKFVAGVGNIYADEALFEAGIHPARLASSLRRTEKERLFEAIRLVLERGITYGGTSLRDYINSDGDQGSNQEELMVYGRKDEPCLRCGSLIRKIVISRRGTHFCPKCQEMEGRSISTPQ